MRACGNPASCRISGRCLSSTRASMGAGNPRVPVPERGAVLMPAMGRWRWSTFAMGLLSVVLVCAIALMAEQSPAKKDQAERAAKKGQAAGAAAPQKAAPAKRRPASIVGDDAKCIDCHDTVGHQGHGARPRVQGPSAQRQITAASRATAPARSTSTRRRARHDRQPEEPAAGPGERDVHDLPRSREARAVGRQPARSAQRSGA